MELVIQEIPLITTLLNFRTGLRHSPTHSDEPTTLALWFLQREQQHFQDLRRLAPDLSRLAVEAWDFLR